MANLYKEKIMADRSIAELIEDAKEFVDEGIKAFKQGIRTEIAGEEIALTAKVGSEYGVGVHFPRQGIDLTVGYIRVPADSHFEGLSYPHKGLGVSLTATGNFSELPKNSERIEDSPKRIYTETEKQQMNDKTNALRMQALQGVAIGQNQTQTAEQTADWDRMSFLKRLSTAYASLDRSEIEKKLASLSPALQDGVCKMIEIQKAERNHKLSAETADRLRLQVARKVGECENLETAQDRTLAKNTSLFQDQMKR